MRIESSSGFYYPTPASRVLELPGGRLADTASAQVTLAELPFVSLRHGLPEALLTGHASYNQTVEAARRALAPPLLQLDLASRRVRAAGKIFALPPAELALLSVFARRALHGEEPLPAPPKELRDVEWKRRYLVELHWIDGLLGERDDTERALKKGMDGSYFSTHLSKLRKILKRELGPAATPYLISDGGSRPRRYRLEAASIVLPDGEAVFFTADDGLIRPPPSADFGDWLRRAAPPLEIGVRLVTPLRIKEGGDLLRHAPDYSQLLHRLFGRLDQLAHVIGNEPPLAKSARAPLLDEAARVALVAADVRWHELGRRSARTQQRMRFGGLLGHLRFAGDLTQTLPWLLAGQQVQIGGKTAFGFGGYQVAGNH